MTIYRMHCPKCGHEGTDAREHIAASLVEFHNDARHGGDRVARFEEVDAA